MFVNELSMYVDHLKNEIDKSLTSLNNNKVRYLKTFQNNLLEGVKYYRQLSTTVGPEAIKVFRGMQQELNKWEEQISAMLIPTPIPVPVS